MIRFELSNFFRKSLILITIVGTAFLFQNCNLAQNNSFLELQKSSMSSLTNTAGSNISDSKTSFQCLNSDSEKFSSTKLLRLTGVELKNTYINLLPSVLWSELSNFYYLLPNDNFDGKISTFSGTFTSDEFDAVSRFNEIIAQKLVSNSSYLTSFFGSCASTSSFTKSCFDTFLNTKGRIIFRSALKAQDNANIWSSVILGASVSDQLQILAQIVLSDPRFLFHIEIGETNPDSLNLISLTSYEIANRISYGMTSSPPDSLLFADAQANKLKDLAVVSAHVDRITLTSGFKKQVVEILKYYTGVYTPSPGPTNSDFLQGLNTSGLDTAITAELSEYLNYIVFIKKGNLQDLMNSNYSFPSNTTLAQIMNSSVWTAGTQPSISSTHIGLLARPYFNVSNALNTPYISRAKMMRGNLLCSPVAPPSAADIAKRPTMTEADLIALTRRNYIDKATLAGGSCLICHSQLNQLGYMTGNFDTLGRYVTTEKIYNLTGTKLAEHPIDTVSTPKITSEDNKIFSDLNQFQTDLADNNKLQNCFTRRTFQFLEKTSEDDVIDGCKLKKMQDDLKSGKPLLSFFTDKFKSQSILYKKIQ